MVPIRFAGGSLIRVSAEDIADVGATIAAARGSAATGGPATSGRPAASGGPAAPGRPAADYDLVVWAEVAQVPADVPEIAKPYLASGATWWIETAKPEPRWWEGVQERVAGGV
jgi:hypothetical protein